MSGTSKCVLLKYLLMTSTADARRQLLQMLAAEDWRVLL